MSTHPGLGGGHGARRVEFCLPTTRCRLLSSVSDPWPLHCRYYSVEFELLEVSGKTVMGATYIQVSCACVCRGRDV